LDTIIPLGDQAALAYFQREDEAAQFAAGVRTAAPVWLVDVVQAYASVAIFFDPGQIPFDQAAQALRSLQVSAPASSPTRQHVIPCCYNFALDLERVAAHTGLTVEEVIREHTGQEYTVYAIGFCPGFPYLGYLPPVLAGVPRLPTPRLRVDEGSVGLTGRQTGVYTQPRPGGWNLVGRTPLQLVDVADAYFPLRTGDRVRFCRVDTTEFAQLRGQRLGVRQSTEPIGN
jgi:inhibitor of KinA